MNKVSKGVFYRNLRVYLSRKYYEVDKYYKGDGTVGIRLHARYMDNDPYTGYDTLHEEEVIFEIQPRSKGRVYTYGYYHHKWEGF